MTGRIGISGLYGGYQDLNSRANGLPKAFKSLLKLFLGILTNSDIFYESFNVEDFPLFILDRSGIDDDPKLASVLFVKFNLKTFNKAFCFNGFHDSFPVFGINIKLSSHIFDRLN